nr:MAG TPA_asm: TPR repeat protein [Caudoviricetes sp.]
MIAITSPLGGCQTCTYLPFVGVWHVMNSKHYLRTSQAQITKL